MNRLPLYALIISGIIALIIAYYLKMGVFA